MEFQKQAKCDKWEPYQEILSRNPRMERIVRQISFPTNDAAAVTSVCVLAPALGSFTQWLLQGALTGGKERLYFLARDGYLMYQAAGIFCEVLDLPVTCRYLSCSRYSLRLPALHRNREEALDFLCRKASGMTPEKLLRRAGLTQEESADVLRRLSLGLQPEEALAPARLPEIRRALACCPTFWTYVDEHSREAMPGLAGYLRQEGLLEERPYAIVDSGWTGSMQKTLGDILGDLGRGQQLEGYYWGLYEAPPHVDRRNYHCCYFRPEDGLREKVFFNNCLFEAVFTAPHGMTLGYRRQGPVYVPVYGASPAARNGFLQGIEPYFRQYIRILAAETGKAEVTQYDFRQDLPAIRALLKSFMTRPSREEAETFGSLPFSDDVLEGGETQLAAPLTQAQIRRHHPLPRLLNLSRSPFQESPWYEGSVMRYGRGVGYHLLQHTMFQYLRYIRKIRYARKKDGKSHGRFATAQAIRLCHPAADGKRTQA